MNNSNEIGYAQIKAETDAGIRRGWDHSHILWREEALKVILETAIERATFSANDVTGIIKNLEVKTHDNRAIAGVIMAAKRLRWIFPTGETEISAAGHLSRVQIWKSLIYGRHDIKSPESKQTKLL